MDKKYYLVEFAIIALLCLSYIMFDEKSHAIIETDVINENPKTSNVYETEFIKSIGTHELRNGACTMTSTIAVNSTGYVFVFDQYDNRIQVFDPVGNFVLKLALSGVQYMEFNASDYLYIATGGSIQIYDPGLNYVDEITLPTEWGWFSPRGLTFNSTGYLYVTDTSNQSVRVFTPEGILLRTIGEGTFDDPYAIQINGTGYFFIADYYNYTIQIYNPGETYYGQIYLGMGNSAYDMKINATGHLHILGYSSIKIYNPDNSFLKSFSEEPNGYGQYMALDGASNFYYRDYDTNGVKKYSMNGELLQFFGYSAYSEPGQFNVIEDIAQNATGYYYISDGENHRIQIFTPDGQYLSEFGEYGSGSGQFDHPGGLDINGTGHVYVCDYYNDQIDVYDQNGNFITDFGSTGSTDGKFKYAEDVAVNDSGYVYVADRDNHRIQYFSPTGEFLGKWTVQMTTSKVYGVDTNSTGYVFVMDESEYTPKTVNIYTSNGTVVLGFGSSAIPTDFNEPKGIGLDSDSKIYCADTLNNRIKIYDNLGNLLYKFGQFGTADGEFSNPHEVMVNGSGYIHVIDWQNRVQIFKLKIFPGPEAPILNAITPSISTTGIINLSWNSPLMADNYSVYRYSQDITNQNYWLATRIANKIPGTSLQDIWQVEGTWWYAVVAHNETGDSPVSVNKFVTIDLPTPEPPHLNIIDPANSDTGLINLTWNEPFLADNYTVYRYFLEITDLNLGNALAIASEIHDPTYQDNWPNEGEWWYAVVAHNETGNSPLSNSQKVIIDLPNATAPILEDILPNPSLNGTIQLNWNIDPFISNYTVLRYTVQITTGNEHLATILTSNLIGTSYNDNLSTNGTYWYSVIAYNATGRSVISVSRMVIVAIPTMTSSNVTTNTTTTSTTSNSSTTSSSISDTTSGSSETNFTTTPSTPTFEINGYYNIIVIFSIFVLIIYKKKHLKNIFIQN